MKEDLPPKGFFKKNPLQKTSAAVYSDYFARTLLIDELSKEIDAMIEPSMSDARRTLLEQNRREIDMLSSGEEIARYMRRKYDVLLTSQLCKKTLPLIEDAAPHIIRRYKTTAQDTFIEQAFCIFFHADRCYAEELYAAYHEIRNPYAQATACLLFGEHGMEVSIPLLMQEYQRFQADYPEESFDQFPLLALYILFGKA